MLFRSAWVGEMLVKGLSGSIDSNGGQAVKAAKRMSEDINDVMHSLADDMSTALPTEFSVDGSRNFAALRFQRIGRHFKIVSRQSAEL